MTEAGFQNYKQQLGELTAFMKTGAFASFKTTQVLNIEGLKESIVATIPSTPESTAAVLLLQGELQANVDFLNFFEDACSRLRADIEQQEALVFNQERKQRTEE